MNDKDEPALAPAEIKEVPLLPADGSAVPVPVGDVLMPATSARASSNRGLRPNTWTVPLSLERTSQELVLLHFSTSHMWWLISGAPAI